MFSVRVCNSPERPVPAVFGVFIDDRRLPSFMTRVGLKRRPEQGTKGCSFDCRCKDTTFSGRMQAFTLTFYVRKAISSCNTKSSIDFLSELYCRNNEKARKDSEVAEEMKRGHLVSMSFRVIWKSKCHFHCYSIYKYLFIYIYSDFLTLGKHNDPKWLWPNDPLNVMLEWVVC